MFAVDWLLPPLSSLGVCMWIKQNLSPVYASWICRGRAGLGQWGCRFSEPKSKMSLRGPTFTKAVQPPTDLWKYLFDTLPQDIAAGTAYVHHC